MSEAKVGRVILFAGTDLLVEEPPRGGGTGVAAAEDLLARLPVDGSMDLPFVGTCDFLCPSGDDLRSGRDNASGGLRWSARSLDEEAAKEAELRGLRRLPLRQAVGLWSEAVIRPVLKGLALLNWLGGARRCGACGTALVDVPADDPDRDLRGSGARVCPACRRSHFPRISPAVIVLVRRGDRILLARNARLPPGGRFGLLAGFVEVGETLEEAAVREVREESGIEIGGLRYVRSQPWPFPDSLMLAFTADWVSGEARPDGFEIAELRWCGADDLPIIPPPGSVARSLIDGFFSGERPAGGG